MSLLIWTTALWMAQAAKPVEPPMQPGNPPAQSAGPGQPMPLEPAAPPKVFPPRVPVATVIDGFLKSIQDNATYKAEARAFVAESAAKPGAKDSPEFINQSLAVLSPPFKAALDLVFDDKGAAAADAFEVLAKDKDPYLAAAAANLAATSLIDLDQIERALTILTRVEKQHSPIEQYTTGHDRYLFMRGLCQVHVLEYDGAFDSLEEFLGRYPDAPERLRVSAAQILTELSRRAPGRIGDVRDLLEYAKRRINGGETSKPVIDRQREAVALLDTLIEEAEEQEKNQGQGDGQGGGGKGGGGDPNGNQQPSGGGANRSTAPGGESREGQLRKNVARPGDAWGKMPPREREQILQALQKQYPSQYRELLEQYYRQLSKDTSKP